jgi:hypothetical protein
VSSGELPKNGYRAAKKEFYRCGSDDDEWIDYWIITSWWHAGVEVMHWDGQDYVRKSVRNFDGAATLAGTSPAVVRYWMWIVSDLPVGCISRKDCHFGNRHSAVRRTLVPSKAALRLPICPCERCR